MAVSLIAFNRGLISKLAAARFDMKRMAFSARRMINWMPRVLGPMSFRAGLQYIDTTFANKKALHIPFIFSSTDTALVELTDYKMTVRVNDTRVSYPSVSTAVTNGNFASETGWTDSGEAGAASTVTGGYMTLTGNGAASARRDQTIAVSLADRGIEHALRIVVTHGRVTLTLGSSSAGSTEFFNTVLEVGEHFLSFTPTGANVYLRLANSSLASTFLSSIGFTNSLVITTPWSEASLGSIRYDASGDVIWCAAYGVKPKRIERRSAKSWSLVDYVVENGPWRLQNTDDASTIASSGLTGFVTLTASKDIFTAGNVGSLYRIESIGQKVTANLAANNSYTGHVRVTGSGTARALSVNITGVWAGTLTLERSISEPGDWSTVNTYTANTTTSYNDGLTNQIVYYRIGFQAAGYTSGTAVPTLTYSAGSKTGIAKVTSFINAKQVNADVLTDLGGTAASADWSESAWSARRGFPSATVLHDGRLWWAGLDKVHGSVSDSYNSFDPDTEGDAGPISRAIGSGPVDDVNWLASADNLHLGGQGAVYVCRASTLDEPLTPSAFSIKSLGSLGCAKANPVKVDTSIIFSDRTGNRAYEIIYENGAYALKELTAMIPEIGNYGFKRIAVQRAPDTRIHFIREDGKVAVLVFDKVENVSCWVLIETDGIVEDVVVLPGALEDTVYYTVARTIGGKTRHYFEKFALDSTTKGYADTRLSDSHKIYSGASTTDITGLAHLRDKTVVVWGNGKDLGSYTVAADGSITLSEAVTWCCVGLPYTAQFQSTRLGRDGIFTIAGKQKLGPLGLLLADTHINGIRFGSSFEKMDKIPRIIGGEHKSEDTVFEEYEYGPLTVPGEWGFNSALCLEASSPRPCTVLAATLDLPNT